jgi:hypothetical protein
LKHGDFVKVIFPRDNGGDHTKPSGERLWLKVDKPPKHDTAQCIVSNNALYPEDHGWSYGQRIRINRLNVIQLMTKEDMDKERVAETQKQ